MVLGVCRRVLGNEADAEDAFQATFLVLVRRADSVVPRARVGNWLYGVAHNVALKARALDHKRRLREREAARPVAGTIPPPPLAEVLDREVSRLPDKYRLALVLCDLEGVTLREAAGRLACPVGTVASRLARARDLLARRLGRYGLALTTAALVGALAPAPVPAALFVAASRAGAAVPAGVAALAEKVVKAMGIAKLRRVAGVLTLLAVVGLAAGAAVYQALAAGGSGPGNPGAGGKRVLKVQLQGQLQFKGKAGNFRIEFGPPPPPMPAGPMPLNGLARLAADERLVVKLSGVSLRPALKLDLPRGEVREDFATSPAQVTYRFPRKKVRAFDARGKPVSAAEVRRRLKTWTRVLVSQDGKEVDPLHLALFKDEALILVPPRKVAAPVLYPADDNPPPAR
jgi:RNA polymerase sigma factor (sigma-70 family)